MSEIKLRAIAQIAKLSRELKKAQFEHNEKGKLRRALTGEQAVGTKEQQIQAAGLYPSTVRRHEQLAAPTEELEPVFEEATEARRPFPRAIPASSDRSPCPEDP